jgi:hypothetical protein
MTEELDLDTIRIRLEQEVKKHGLRCIARQVGMSPSGLHKLLNGASPYQKTQRKALLWWERIAAGDARSPQEVLVDELVNTLPGDARETARTRIMRVVAKARRWPAIGSPATAYSAGSQNDT